MNVNIISVFVLDEHSIIYVHEYLMPHMPYILRKNVEINPVMYPILCNLSKNLELAPKNQS